MGIVSYAVTFDGEAPPLALAGERVGALTGLAVAVLEADPPGVTHAQDSRFSFTVDPRQVISVYTYRPGAVAEFSQATLGDLASVLGPALQGMKEPAGTQAVHVRGYAGQEPTLLLATVLALESLGGRSAPPVSEAEREKYGRSVTEAELRHRRRSAGWRVAALYTLGVPAILLSSPFWIARGLLRLPGRIRRALGVLKSLEEKDRSG